MIDATIAQPAHPSTPEPTPAYVLRGLGLFELHAGEILASYQGGGKYLVPSGTTASGLYEVRIGVRRNRCECRGWASHGHCSHVVAASRVARRSGVCDGCGERSWRRDLSEVQESLTYFEGDLLCPPCRHGSDADVL